MPAVAIQSTCKFLLTHLSTWKQEQTAYLSTLSDRSSITALKQRHTIISKSVKESEDQIAILKQAINDEETAQQVLQTKMNIIEDAIRVKKASIIEQTAANAAVELEIAQKSNALQIETLEREELDRSAAPRWNIYSTSLGFDIITLSQDILRFEFTMINEMDWDEKHWFTVDMTQSDYTIVECKPAMDSQMKIMSEWLNETKDFYAFVKMVRNAFCLNARTAQVISGGN